MELTINKLEGLPEAVAHKCCKVAYYIMAQQISHHMHT